jgi:hypothetical protein
MLDSQQQQEIRRLEVMARLVVQHEQVDGYCVCQKLRMRCPTGA